MQKILVPCDFSEQAIIAFRMAIDLGQQANQEIHLLHVVEIPIMNDSLLMPTLSFEASLLKELSDGAEKRFAKITAEFSAATPVITKIAFGNPPTMILDYIVEHQIDLVVMGTKGSSGLQELLIGSTTEKIVRRSSCPVITVRKYVPFKTIQNIVFPNALDEEQEDLIAHVKALQSFLKATLHIVWINTPGNFTADTITQSRLKDFARRYMFINYTTNVFNDTYEESGVINFAHFINADIIAMGTHGRRGLQHIVSGSVAEDVVNHIDSPIWTYTIKKAGSKK